MSKRISWINASALANDVVAEMSRAGRCCGQGYWFDLRDRIAEQFSEGPAYLEDDGESRRIRWANGLSFRDPPKMAARLADGRFI